VRSTRECGASVAVAASSWRRAAAAGRPADEDNVAMDDNAQLAAAGAGWRVCRTDEPDTTGSGTGASRSGQRSPDDVIRSPGHPARVLPSMHLQTQKLHVSFIPFNPLDSKRNYGATSNNTKLIHWPLMAGLLHLVQREGAWAGCGPAQSLPRCTKCKQPTQQRRVYQSLYCYMMVRCSAVLMWRLKG